MLRIAVQAKGRLFEETMALLGESDIKINGVIPPVIDVTVAIIPFVNSRQTLSSGQI